MAQSSPVTRPQTLDCNRTHTGKTKSNRTKPRLRNPPQTCQSLKVMVINFQGVWGKVAELAVCLENHQPDIVIGTESWLSEVISNSEIVPPNYTVIRKDRDSADFGPEGYGGVFIAVKSDLIIAHRHDLDSDNEIVWL